jgi:hypothetical protein
MESGRLRRIYKGQQVQRVQLEMMEKMEQMEKLLPMHQQLQVQ